MIKKRDNLVNISLILFSFVLMIGLVYRYGHVVLDSDMASEAVLANLLNKEEGILSHNWIGSTELRIFGINLTLKFGLLLSPNNWLIARVISQICVYLIYGASFLLFLKSAGLDKKSFYLASLVILPLGMWNLEHNIFSGFYLIHTIPVVLLSALLIKSFRKPSTINISLLVIFSFIAALNGMKVILYFSIPICVAAFLYNFFENTDSKDLLNVKNYKLFGLSILSFISSIIGFVVYKMLCLKYELGMEYDFIWKEFSLNRIFDSLSYYLNLFGYPANEYIDVQVNLFSRSGIFGVFSLAGIVLIVVSFIYVLNNFKKLNNNQRLIATFCYSQIIIVIISLTSVYELNGSYFLPLIPFTFVIIELAIELLTNRIPSKITGNICRIIVFLVFLLGSIPCTSWYINSHPLHNNLIDGVVEYLEENNINKVYATFWDGNVVTELSNGKVEASVVCDPIKLDFHKWLQDKRHESDRFDGEYIIVNRDYKQWFYKNNIGNYEIVFDNGFLVVRVINMRDYLYQSNK